MKHIKPVITRKIASLQNTLQNIGILKICVLPKCKAVTKKPCVCIDVYQQSDYCNNK